MEILLKAFAEEESRRFSIIKEFRELFTTYISAPGTVSLQNLSSKLQDNLNILNQLTEKLNLYQDSSYAVRTHKNKEISECALNILKKYGIMQSWDVLQSNFPFSKERKTFFYDNEKDVKGSSTINCLQMLYFTALALKLNSNNFTFVQSAIHNNAYNPKTSAVLQTADLPLEVRNDDIYLMLKDTIFYFHDAKSKDAGELVCFHLGYIFGGSRANHRYFNKNLRAEDCSSSISKWVGGKYSFTTYHMKKSYNNNCDSDQICQEVQRYLKPKGDALNNVDIGDVYAYKHGGHTGIVASIINNTCFESLSYSRHVPEVEGLGYGIDCLTNKDYIFFSYI